MRKVRNFAQLTNNISWQKIGVDPSPVCSGGCAGNQNLCCQIFAVVASSTKLFFQNMVILYTINGIYYADLTLLKDQDIKMIKKSYVSISEGTGTKSHLLKSFSQ